MLTRQRPAIHRTCHAAHGYDRSCLTEAFNWDCNVYGGFYTQEDIKEVVAYARKRFITVIPEIEMPGHSVAALAAYKAGYNVIMSPNSHMYFNHRQYDKNVEKIGATHFLPLSRAYSYNPTPASLTPDEAKYILGVQANLWTEYLCTMAEMEYMLYPRVAALSEVAWTPKDAKNYDKFMLRLNDIQQVYDKVGIGACKITK